MRDWVPTGEISFLAGDSEMARRIRGYDWSTHPFGPSERWPQSLRSALSICLHSAFPTAIYWGPELRLLYNDAWAPIPGPRHPGALGAPARDVWADIWHVIEPQFEHLLQTGAGLFVENQMLPMARFGAPEETYWNYSFTAIRGEDGEISGIFNSGSEVTTSVRSERQIRFLLDYGEALRRADGGDVARGLALSMLGENLRVDRVGIAEVGDAPGTVSITGEWVAPAARSLEGGEVVLSRFGPDLAGALAAGRSVISDDISTDPRFDADARAVFASYDVAAFIAVPWRVGGRMVGVVYTHSTRPRAWSSFDITTVEALLERTRAWIGVERAAERERIMVREIDHRARNALAVAQSVVRLTRADDIATFRAKAEERIGALSRAHSLLAERHWRSIDLGLLVERELEPYTDGQGRISVRGPEIELRPEMGQSLALVLHELATNAAKHGALSSADGRLSIAWHMDEAGTLQLRWDETLAEGVPAGSERRGFGSILLGRVIEGQLGGSLETALAEDGLKVRIALPLSDSPGAERIAERAAAATDGRVARVMVLEDEALVAVDLEATLEGLGLAIFGVFGTLREAEAALEHGAPEVAVLDANLRGASSVALAQRMAAAGTQVIFVTGYNALSDLPEDLSDTPVLSKPVDARELASVLDRVIG